MTLKTHSRQYWNVSIIIKELEMRPDKIKCNLKKKW